MDSLPTRVVGGLRPSMEVVWTRDDAAGTPEDLTAATLTGTITDRAGTARAIVGALTVTDGAAGVFTWAFAAADLVAPGTFQVQFTAAFSTQPSPAKSFAVELTVV